MRIQRPPNGTELSLLSKPTLGAALLPWTIALACGLEYFDNAVFPFFIAHMARGLHAAADELIWASSAYTAAAILGILGQQWWVEHIGYRRYFSACLLLFALGSFGCASSTSVIELALGRGFQGYFIGPLMGACRIFLKVDLAPPRQAFATRLFVFFILAGTALAPLAGAYLVASFGWRFLFVASGICGIALAALACVTVTDTGRRPAHQRIQLHVWPYVVFAIAQGALQIALQQARYRDVGASPGALLLSVGGVVLLCWFGWQQWHHPRPLVRLHALREAAFRTGIVLYVFFYFTNTALSYLISRVLEASLGYTVVTAGRMVGLTGFAALPAMFVYFRYSPRIVHRKRVIVPGFGIAVLIAAWLACLAPGASTALVAPPLFLRGLLLFCIALPVAGGTFGVFAADDFNHGYRFKNIVKQMANSFATAAVITLEQHRFALHYAPLADGAGITARQAHYLSLVDSCWMIALIAAGGGLFALVQKRIH